jgi:hypothetical protein
VAGLSVTVSLKPVLQKGITARQPLETTLTASAWRKTLRFTTTKPPLNDRILMQSSNPLNGTPTVRTDYGYGLRLVMDP